MFNRLMLIIKILSDNYREIRDEAEATIEVDTEVTDTMTTTIEVDTNVDSTIGITVAIVREVADITTIETTIITEIDMISNSLTVISQVESNQERNLREKGELLITSLILKMYPFLQWETRTMKVREASHRFHSLRVTSITRVLLLDRESLPRSWNQLFQQRNN